MSPKMSVFILTQASRTMVCPILISFAIILSGFSKEGEANSDADPVLRFTHALPREVEFSNTTGARIVCSAEGNPAVSSISWEHLDGAALSNITGLRQVLFDGTLHLLPFRSEDFRQDVHLGVCRCHASSTLGSIVSSEIHLRAVMDVDYESSVYDVFAIRGNMAVIRCHIPTMLQSHVSVDAFIRDDTLKITSPVESEGKYFISSNGVLYVKDVEHVDANRGFKCQTSNRLTKEIRISATVGKLFVTEPQGKIPPNIIDSASEIQELEGKTVMLPCVAQGWPYPQTMWYKGDLPLVLDGRIKSSSYGIIISHAILSDSGIYVCRAMNDVGTDQVETKLQIFVPLAVKVHPSYQAISPMKKSIKLDCIHSGTPIKSIFWMKNGKFVNNKIPQQFGNNTSLILSAASTVDQGVYQCFIQNSREVAQGSAIVVLGTHPPTFLSTFRETTIHPGSPVSFECEASGNPEPNIHWYLDDEPLNNKDRVIIDESIGGNGHTSSIMRVKWTKVEDGGLYSCVARNKAGEVRHQARLNIYGALGSRNVPPLTVVVGQNIHINCPVFGYPIEEILWKKDEMSLPSNIHQDVLPNGTLLLTNVQRTLDSGDYECTASDKEGNTATSSVKVVIMVMPKIMPFSFQEDLLREGMRAQLQCVVTEGDPPISISWSKDAHIIPHELDVSVREVDQFSSILAIRTITPRHNGNYTCVARNAIGTATHTARLAVNVSPRIVPFSFQSDQMLEGALARTTCVVYQGDLPLQLSWLKDGIPIIDDSIEIKVVDDYTSLLTIAKVESKHSGLFTCVAKNAASSATHSAELEVKVPPKIVAFSFQDDELVEGMYARVSCVVSRGDLPIEIWWTKNHQAIPPVNLLNLNIKNMDEFTSVLSIDHLSTQHNGNYTCFAKNAAATTSFTAPLKINVPAQWTIRPDNVVTVMEGKSTTVHCQAHGHPKPVITWIKKGNTIGAASEALKSGPHNTVYENGTLHISETTGDMAGLYYCSASNGVGRQLTTAVKLQIEVPAKLIIPSGNHTARKGEDAILKCEATGNKPITITWYAGGILLPDSKFPRYTSNQHSSSDKVSSELLITKAGKSDSVDFSCQAKNEFGEDSSRMWLIVQGRPDPPHGVKAIERGNRTVEVTWNIPFDGNSPLIRFVIEHNEKGGIPKSQTVSGRSTGLIIKELRPSTTYRIAVAAENDIGRSEAEGIAEITLSGETPSGIPEDIGVQTINSKSLKVSWMPPPKHTWNGSIRGYYVGFREVDSTASYAYKMLEVPEGYSKGLSYTLSELNEFTRYAVIVQAFNDFGKGPASQETHVMTTEDVPRYPPTNISCSTTGSESIFVSWSPPPSKHVHGILRGYKLLYWPVDTLDDKIAFGKFDTTSVKASLKQLEKHSNYSIQVLGYTMAGDGIASEPLFCQTLEDVPSVPAEIKAFSASDESVIIVWRSPTKKNGKILHYTVYAEHELYGQKSSRKHIVQANGHYYEVRSLLKTPYTFYVSASTAIGESEMSMKVTVTPGGEHFPAKCAALSDVIKSHINKPLDLICPMYGIPIPSLNWFHRGYKLLFNERVKLLLGGTLSFEKLQLSDGGNYSCIAENSYGQDSVVYSLIIETPPPTPKLFVMATSTNSISLQWKLDMEEKYKVLGYLIHYKTEKFSRLDAINVQPYQTSETIGNLECGTEYEIHISAFNEIGSSPPSEKIRVATQGGVPSVPSMKDLISESISHVTVDLHSWKSDKCPILRFLIEYKKQHSKTWHIVEHDIDLEKKVTIKDLKPGAGYTLRVTAFTAATSVVANYDFLTLSLNEDLENDLKETDSFLDMVDMNLMLIASGCLIVFVMICVSVACIVMRRIKRNNGIENNPDNRGHSFRLLQRPGSSASSNDRRKSSGSGRPLSGNYNDDIEPYAMVKLSDFRQRNNPAQSMPSLVPPTPPQRNFSSNAYNPSAPPISESYALYSAAQGKHARSEDNTFPGRVRHRNTHDVVHGNVPKGHAPTSMLPAIPNGHEGDYDPPPPDLSWLPMKK